MKAENKLTRQALANHARAVVKRGIVPGSEEALAEASEIAARSVAIETGRKNEVRALANELWQHRNGYTKPQGIFEDGVWSPTLVQYVIDTEILQGEAVVDQTDGGQNFRAMAHCKSWGYCWRLADAWLHADSIARTNSFPPYVAMAAVRVDLQKLHARAADHAAANAEKFARALAVEHARASVETLEAKRKARRQKKDAALAKRIEGLKLSIRMTEAQLKGLRTRLKSALQKQKRRKGK